MSTWKKESQIKFNLMRIFWQILWCSCIICNNILWIGTMLGSLPCFYEGELTARFCHWRAIQLLSAKGSLNSDGWWPRWIPNGVNIYTFTRTDLESPLTCPGSTSGKWPPSDLSVQSFSEPHCCFSLSYSMTPCWFFSPPLFSQERDCSSSPVAVYRKREDSWWGRCLGNCMNQSWPYLISGFRSGGQVCFLTVFFPLFPFFFAVVT